MLSQELLTTLRELLPGFMILELFYWLTAHRRPGWMYYVVRALAGTVSVMLVRDAMKIACGHLMEAQVAWNATMDLLVSLLVAAATGVTLAALSNQNFFHGFAFKLGLSRNDGFPSQWYAAFAENQRYILLTLKDGRRIAGWPLKYPDAPEHGHFLLESPYLVESREIGGEAITSLSTTQSLLVDATRVDFVQFLRFKDELPQSNGDNA